MSDNRYSFVKPALLGYLGLATMLGGIGAWSVSTEIAGAVIAGGIVKVQGDRKAVQHADGGMVAEVAVREGQLVKAGELLLRLDGQKHRSELTVLEGQLNEILARKGRLIAERDGAERIAFPPALLEAVQTSASVAEIMGGETRLFEARRDTRQREIAQLSERQHQVQAEIEGTSSQLAALEEQVALLIDEHKDQQSLLDKGLTQRGRVLALQREVSRMKGQIGELRARIAQLRGQSAEIEIERLRLDASRREEVTSALRDLEYNEAGLKERRLSLIESIARLELRAPSSGIVYDLRVNAPKSVVTPAETVMFIIPSDEDLVVSSRIGATDIDQVFVGQSAVMVFPAFDQRMAPEIRGTVARISADAFADETSGQLYYEVELRPDADVSEKLGGQLIVPGMPVESFVMTSTRTPLSYLVKPFTDYFGKAFRES